MVMTASARQVPVPEPVLPMKESVPIDLAKIKALRLKRDFSYADAAAAAGFPRAQQWYKIESGETANVTVATLDKMAKALNVKARDLLK